MWAAALWTDTACRWRTIDELIHLRSVLKVFLISSSELKNESWWDLVGFVRLRGRTDGRIIVWETNLVRFNHNSADLSWSQLTETSPDSRLECLIIIWKLWFYRFRIRGKVICSYFDNQRKCLSFFSFLKAKVWNICFFHL